jgi:hypothetical protein
MAPPNRALRDANIIIILVSGLYSIIQVINRGASFCHVDRIRHDIHVIEDITEGYHVWQGAAPSFRIRDINKMAGKILFVRGEISHIDILLINISLEPRACARKYLIAASDSLFVLVYSIMGIKDRRLSSSLAHT